jgi:peptidyl-prolyl cis-trans isomerase C
VVQTVSQVRTPSVSGRLRRLLGEPILHFIVLGLAILLANHAWRQAQDSHRIVVTAADAEGLARKYEVQFGAPPSAVQMEAIVQAHIEEEAFFREGMALGLDRGDEIVRRRIAQKTEFLQQDIAAPPEPSEAELKAYYDAHRTAYAAEPRMAFRHVFFSPDLDGEAPARRRAETALARLARDADAPVSGDPFPDITPSALSSAKEAVRVFGDTELPRKLSSAPVGRWAGPYRSGYGWHLVLVQSRQEGGVRPFATVRDQVRADCLRDAQDRANTKGMAQVLRRYTVLREDGGGPAKARP